MQRAYLITSFHNANLDNAISKLVGDHLREQGFDTSDLAVSLLVTGITKNSDDSDDEDVDGDDDDGDAAFHSWNEQMNLHRPAVLAEITERPQTIRDIATTLNLEWHLVEAIVSWGEGKSDPGDSSEVAAVAPAREDGKTVSQYMCTGTEAFNTFVAAEKARIELAITKWAPQILKHAPKFYQAGADRMRILESVCGELEHADAEELRMDCRNVFYGMVERNLLFRHNHGWKAFRTAADQQNLEMLGAAVREVEGFEGMVTSEIAEKLPGFVDLGLLQHVLGR